MGARNRVGIGLSYRPAARLHRLVESIPWNRFLGSLKVLKYRLFFFFQNKCKNAANEQLHTGNTLHNLLELYLIKCTARKIIWYLCNKSLTCVYTSSHSGTPCRRLFPEPSAEFAEKKSNKPINNRREFCNSTVWLTDMYFTVSS